MQQYRIVDNEEYRIKRNTNNQIPNASDYNNPCLKKKGSSISYNNVSHRSVILTNKNKYMHGVEPTAPPPPDNNNYMNGDTAQPIPRDNEYMNNGKFTTSNIPHNNDSNHRIKYNNYPNNIPPPPSYNQSVSTAYYRNVHTNNQHISTSYNKRAPPPPPKDYESSKKYLQSHINNKSIRHSQPLLHPSLLVDKSKLFEDFCNEFEISRNYVEKISMLDDFDIVFLVDDSGSMKSPLGKDSQFENRWEELKHIVKISIRLATIFDKDGIDLFFLNRDGEKNVSKFDSISHLFTSPPFGRTPLDISLQKILNKYDTSSKQILIIIATDGVPTDNYGYPCITEFTETLSNKNHSKFYVSFLACSDQKQDIGYLNKLEKKIPNVDTINDYLSEVKKNKKKHGNNFSYTLGDHVVRLLLGPICKELDTLNEKCYKCHIL